MTPSANSTSPRSTTARRWRSDPQFAPAANNLAYILAEANRDLNDALKFAQAAKAKMPDDPSVMDTLGWVYYRKGIYDSAIAEFRGSLAKAPDNATVGYHLGLAYAKKGETAKARAELERALAVNPRCRKRPRRKRRWRN